MTTLFFAPSFGLLERPLSLNFASFRRGVGHFVCRADARLGCLRVGAVVSGHMKALHGQFKVLYPVIRLVAVDVVNNLVRPQVAAKVSSHYKPVFFDVPVWRCHRAVGHPNYDVAPAGFGAASFPSRVFRTFSLALSNLGQLFLRFGGVIEALAGKARRFPLSNNLRSSLVAAAHKYPHFIGMNTRLHNTGGL
jgi:hypothetical protein